MLGPATPFAHPDPAHGAGGPTPRQELIAAHYLALGETVGMAARLAGIRAPTLQLLTEEPEFTALVEECRRIEALPRAEQEARLDRFFRRAVERALADGRVGAIAAAMRLLGLGARGGRGPGGGDRQAEDEVSEEELAEAGGRWGMVPDGAGGWLTPEGREAMPGREVDIVIGKDGPVRCLETLELAELSPDFVDSLDDQTLEQTQELNRLAYSHGGPQWDPVTRTFWYWESAKAEAKRLREQEPARAASAPWDPAADVIRQAAKAAATDPTPPPPSLNPKAPTSAEKKPRAAGPDLAVRLDRLLASGTPADAAEADLAEAVCSLLWPNWPAYEGELDLMELWRLRDLLARTDVHPQLLARLGGASSGPRAEQGGWSHPRARAGPDVLGGESRVRLMSLPTRRPVERPPKGMAVLSGGVSQRVEPAAAR
jgi:hypothetical protein